MAELGLLLGGLGTVAAGGSGVATAAGTGAALGGLGSAALTAGLGGAAAAGASALMAQKPKDMTIPTLSASAAAPVEKSPDILDATRRQMAGLGNNGRDSTNLARRSKRKTGTLLDEAGDAPDTVPAYTGTTLG